MFVATKLDLKFCPKNVVLLLLTMKYIEVRLQSINRLVIPKVLVNGLTNTITNQGDD